jgi:hypothetical protein
MTDKPSSESRDADVVLGRVVEIGDIEALGDKPGILIETTREQLIECGINLVFRIVEVRLKDNRRIQS